MTKDYAPLLATAKRLVQKFGAKVTLIKLEGTSADPAKPWLPPADPVGDGVRQELYAVCVEPSSAQSLGLSAQQMDLLKDVSKIYVAEAPATPLESFNLLEDGEGRYKIMFLERLRPATTTLLYFIGVGR